MMAGAAEKLNLPIIDLCSPDRASTAISIRQACVDCGFFYLVNHGVDEVLLAKVFGESKKLFSLPIHDKIKLLRKEDRGYSPLFHEKLDTSKSTGDLKEGFDFGTFEDPEQRILYQWPPEGNIFLVPVDMDQDPDKFISCT